MVVKEAIVANVAPSTTKSPKSNGSSAISSSMCSDRSTEDGMSDANSNASDGSNLPSTDLKLSDFPKLKNPDRWEGHERESCYGKKYGKDSMLRWVPTELRGALTKLPAKKEHEAKALFYNVVLWMGDWPVSEAKREQLHSQIVSKVTHDGELRDEVYVQVMKQLTNNPSRRSTIRGWQLLLSLCQQVCPSNVIIKYVQSFLSRKASTGAAEDEFEAIIRQCLADFTVTVAPDKNDQEDDIVDIDIHLVDHSIRKVRVKKVDTLRELCDKLGEQLQIKTREDFGIFMWTSDFVPARLVPDSTTVLDLQMKLMSIEEKTKRGTKFVFKRKLIRGDEILKSGDLPHASLTFAQALDEFLHYPVRGIDDMKLFLKIAGSVLWLERDCFKKAIEWKRLSDANVLEQLLPKAFLEDKARKKVSNLVLEQHDSVRKALGESEIKQTRLQSMTRVFQAMQGMKLFGAYHWTGSQNVKVTQDQFPVEDGPDRHFLINPREPKAEYYICADYWGVKLVSVGTSGSDTRFSRQFMFNEEAVERVLFWGAKRNLLHLIVSSVDPDDPSKGRVPMSVCMTAPAAVDISYAIYNIYAIRGTEENSFAFAQ